MNILLVEDDPELGSGVRTALVDQGFTVVWVRRLDEATHELGSDHNDLTTDGGGWQIDNCQNPTNLTWMGQEIWNDNHTP